MSEIKSVVKFGTDGWRGIIADDFTYANVRVAARAIAHYVLAHEDAARGRVHRVGHAVWVAVVCEGGGRGAGGGGDSGGCWPRRLRRRRRCRMRCASAARRVA